MGSKERRRRRTILKAAAITAGTAAVGFGSWYLGKKLFGGTVKKGTTPPEVTSDTSPVSSDGGFSDASEEGVYEPPAQAGIMGGDGKILGMSPLVLAGIGIGLFLLYKKG